MMARYLVILLSVFYSSNIEAQWTNLGEWKNSHIGTVQFLEEFGRPEVGFFSIGIGTDSSFIYRTSDYGITWTPVMFTGVHLVGGMTFKNHLTGWAAGANVWSTLVGCIGYIHRTTDGGITWHTVDSSCSVDIHYDRFSENVYAVGADKDGLSVSSDDGLTWKPIIADGRQYSTATSDHKGAIIAAGRSQVPNQSYFLFIQDGEWKESALLSEVGEIGIKEDVFYAINYRDASGVRVRRSSDGGSSWIDVATLRDDLENNSGVIGANRCFLYTQTARHFYKSGDNGITWEVIGDARNCCARFYISSNIAYVPSIVTGTGRVQLWRYVEPVELSAPNPLTLNGCNIDTSVILNYNADCFDGELISADLVQTGDRFTMGALTLPTAVSGEFVIPISYTALVPGSTDNASLKLRFRAGAYTFDTVIAITAQSSNGPAAVGFVARTNNASPKPGERTTVSIYPTASASSVSLNEIEFDLSFEDDLFRIGQITGSLQPSVGTQSVAAGRVILPIAISAIDISLDPNVPVAEIELTALLTDTTTTDVTLSNIKLNGGDIDYARCKLAVAESNGTALSVSLQCGDPLMQRVLRGEKALEIKSINPNPAQGSITIDYESKLEGVVSLLVYSVDGVLVHEQVIASDPHKPLQLDTSGWPSGAYTIVLKSGEEEASASLIKN